jgi:hypothetical protein
LSDVKDDPHGCGQIAMDGAPISHFESISSSSVIEPSKAHPTSKPVTQKQMKKMSVILHTRAQHKVDAG